MHHMISLFVVAVMAMTALSAPAPSKTNKKAFTAKAKGHGKPKPLDAMKKAGRKWGFDVNEAKSEIEARHIDWAEVFSHFDDKSGSPAWPSVFPSWAFPEPTESAAPYLVISSEAPALASSSSVGWPFPLPSSSGGGFSSVPLPSSSAGGFSSVIIPSSAPVVPSSTRAPPAQSSPPSSGGSGNEEGEVAANPEDENESMYLSPVTIGGQKIELDFDTGSADLWTFGPNSGQGGRTVFDPAKSSSWTPYQGGSWMISYGDGSSASGTVGFDTVDVGGAVVKKQAVEVATQASMSFAENSDTDGLLGLAFSSINQISPRPQKTFFDNIMNDLEAPLFTANLEEDNSGTYEFGRIDSSKYTGSLHYTPVDNREGFWQIASESYTIGGSQQACGTCSPSIVDTGTSLLIMDDDIAEAYYSKVQGSQMSGRYGGYVYPCSVTPPDFGIAIGNGYTAVIKGADMTYAPANEAGTVCFGGIQPGGTQAGYNILGSYCEVCFLFDQGDADWRIGDVLLKQFFAVFDGGKMQFGIAPKA